MTRSTARNVQSVLSKLGVHSQREAVEAARNGLVSVETGVARGLRASGAAARRFAGSRGTAIRPFMVGRDALSA